MLKKLFDINYFFSNIVIPVIALTLYCVTFAYLSSRFLTEGVNYYFTAKVEKYLLLVLIPAILIFFVLLKKHPRGTLDSKSWNEKFYAGDLFLLFLPLTPIVQYVLKNQEILSPSDSVYTVIFFLLFSSIYIIIIPTFLGVVIRSRALLIIGLAFVFTILSMSSISAYFNWFEIGALRKQLTVLGGVLLFVWIFYNLDQRKVLYFFIIANFVFNSSTVLVSQSNKEDVSSTSFEGNKLLSLVNGKEPAFTPNIYLLVYDAYVPNETMLAYGIDNSAQEQYLMDQGFMLYPHTYSVGSSSVETMSRMLNASTELYGNRRRAVSGDGVVHTVAKELGYETYGLFPTDYMFYGVGSRYDHFAPVLSIPPYIQLSKAILVGEFRFDIENVGFNSQSREQFLESKRSLFKKAPGNQIFLYSHSNLPAHTQNSGACLANETEHFKDRLTVANSEMQQDVNLIIKNDPGAVIIVAGDHGPYLTKNCDTLTDIYPESEISRLDIQDRYGTFLAIRWPTQDFVNYDDITILQDVFPAVFTYLYQDPSILDSKIKPSKTLLESIGSVYVENGMIHGGLNDGEPLYLSEE